MNDKIVKKLWEKGFIISVDAIEFLKNINVDIEELLDKLKSENITVITKQTLEKIIKVEDNTKNIVDSKVNIKHSRDTVKTVQKGVSKGVTILKFIQQTTKIETKNKIKIERKISIELEKTKDGEQKKEIKIELPKKRRIGEEIELKVKIIKNYTLSKHEINVSTWVSYYRARLNKLKQLLKNHSELKYFVSLNALNKDYEEITVAGLVRDKKITQKGVIITLEDSRGLVKVFIPNDIEDFDIIKSVPLDCVVAVIGRYIETKKLLIANSFFYPDIPYKQPKKVEDDVWVAFTGDFQIGNRNFLKKPFERFIKWLNGEFGNEKQKEIARKVGYLILTGDLVDGVGIYPNQEQELEIKTAEGQYAEFERYMLEVPESIQIIAIPGNHDIVRLAEPQPPIPKEFLPQTFDLDNFYYLSNPAYIRIHGKIDILIYHGYSMDWYVSEIPYIREKGGYDKPEEIMKFMLMLRHLAPTHGSTPYVPYPTEDPLIIDPVPDIFVTGHIHRTAYGVYKGVELINASCFQDITPYQLELGHKPDPGKVILKNLKTGEVKILNFLAG